MNGLSAIATPPSITVTSSVPAFAVSATDGDRAEPAGVDLSLGGQLGVAYLAILGGIGTAGVPSGSIPFVILILISIGVDPSLIAIITGCHARFR